MERILTVDEAAKALHATNRTVYEWLKRGSIPGRKVGKTWLIRETSLLRYLDGPTLSDAAIGIGAVPAEGAVRVVAVAGGAGKSG
jgi:excisionase family DNA binding protein